MQRVGEHYLKPANRVVGTFVPTAAPERAEIPPTPDFMAALESYRGGDGMRLGEAFDPSPQNIEARVVRRSLSNGIRAALLPKKTRGGRVVATLALHWGDEKSLTHREVACSFAGEMLGRGTLQRTRAELKEALVKLNASVSLSGHGASLEVRRENLIPALLLVAEALREPSFPAGEFEEMKRAALTGAESQKSDPAALARVRLARHLQEYPVGHPRYTPSIDERIEWMRAAKLEDALACYRELYGATGAEFAAVGDFDADEVSRAVDELFGPWKTPRPFERVPARYFERPPYENALLTPDKANAVLRGGFDLPMRDDHPDFPALVLANGLIGGSSTARLTERVREKEGLSYSTYTSFYASSLDPTGAFRVHSIYAPQNRARIEAAIREELERELREGFDAKEVEAGKQGVLQARRLSRTQDRALAERLAAYLFVGRTFAWDVELESRIAALSADELNAALRRHLDAARLSLIFAGDFGK